MEEKVQYQSDERLRDVNEVLENCQTRVCSQSYRTLLNSIQWMKSWVWNLESPSGQKNLFALERTWLYESSMCCGGIFIQVFYFLWILNTQITKMEHLSQQQYVTVEGIDNSNARALIVKLINVVLTVLQVVLLLVATAAGIIMPFLKTR